MIARSVGLKIAVALAAAAIGGVGAWVLASPGASPGDHAQAWIDDPIDGTVAVSGPLPIVVHAFDPEGVVGVELSVDGVVIETAVGDGAELVNAQWSWAPPGPGTYLLEVVGVGSGGVRGIPGRAIVEVPQDRLVAPPTSTPVTTTTAFVTSTTTSSTTTTVPPTTTSSTTTTVPPTTSSTTTPGTTTTSPTTTTATTAPPPCTPPGPILLSPSDGSWFGGPGPSIDLDWAAWRGSPPSCQPSGFRVQVSTDSGFGGIVATADFGSETTIWTPPTSTWVCNTTHYWRVWSKRSDGVLGQVSVSRTIYVFCVG